MKYFLPAVIIALLFASCTYKKHDNINYDIYASILDKEYGHFLLDSPYIIGVNDTIADFKNELAELIYGAKNYNLFFKETCMGDSSFKDFILSIKTIEINKEVMDIEKLKAKTKVRINLNKLIHQKKCVYTVWFSKVVLNKKRDKAILFINQGASGSLYFVELINQRWTVKYSVLSWIA
jgi:hypothetical protein